MYISILTEYDVWNQPIIYYCEYIKENNQCGDILCR